MSVFKQLVQTKTGVAEAFSYEGFKCFYFLHCLDISKDIWVGHLLDLSPISGGNPALIVQDPVSLAALLMCLFCSVLPAVC